MNFELKVACQKELRRTGKSTAEPLLALLARLQGDATHRKGIVADVVEDARRLRKTTIVAALENYYQNIA